ncbi:MAG TPA: DUF2784 family protein [Elusimicrobiota bacterium]|nr:DUF2784 family protein [Elusimicrobiota bacterium]
MFWKILVDAIVVVHLGWIALFIFGPFLAVRYRILRTAYLVFMWITAIFPFCRCYCPLTVVENCVRLHYDPSSAYATTFIQNQLDKIASCTVNPRILASSTIGWAVLWTVAFWILRLKKRRV